MNKTFLLVGNPNVGKTTIFNKLTNSIESIGNFSGVTVEKKVGKISKDKLLIDLPGSHSILPNSADEGVTSRELLFSDHQGIINVCDVSALTRNLHLTLQLLETGYPMTLIMNLSDEFLAAKRSIDVDYIANEFEIDVHLITAKDEKDLSKIITSVEKNTHNHFKLKYPDAIETAISEFKELIPHNQLKRRFIAIQILEGNEEVKKYVRTYIDESVLDNFINKCNENLKETTDYPSSKVAIFQARSKYISDLLDRASYTKMAYGKIKTNQTYKIDKVLTNRFVGPIIFALTLFLIYYVTFTLVGAFLSDTLDAFIFGFLQKYVEQFLNMIGINGIAFDFLINGVYTGALSILIFLPQVILMFFFLSILESVGYLSRVGVMFDHILSKVGLNGKSVIPMITGMGCNVPAIMGTRVIDSKKERMMTIFVIPFISCSARIPIYAIFASILLPNYVPFAILGVQILGILVVIGVSWTLNRTYFKNYDDSLVMEVPPYRVPQMKHVFKVTQSKANKFIHNVIWFVTIGTIIVWFFSSFSIKGYASNPDESILSHIAGFIAPIFSPIGFGDWRSVSSLISGFMAKEQVISTLAVLYNANSNDLPSVLSGIYSTASASAFLVFNALYIPCIATVPVIRRELNSIKLTVFSLCLSFGVAYLVAFVVYTLVSIFT